MNLSDAYRNSYNVENSKDKTVHEKACLMNKSDKIQARLAELEQQQQDYLNYTADKHFKEMEEARRIAIENENESAIIKATELKGKMSGHYTDKSEVEMKGNVGITVNIVTNKASVEN